MADCRDCGAQGYHEVLDGYVSREMAIDAGEPLMEGQPVHRREQCGNCGGSGQVEREPCGRCGHEKTEELCKGDDECPNEDLACEGWSGMCCQCGSDYALNQVGL